VMRETRTARPGREPRKRRAARCDGRHWRTEAGEAGKESDRQVTDGIRTARGEAPERPRFDGRRRRTEIGEAGRATDRSRTGTGPRGAKPRSGPRCDGRRRRTETGEAGRATARSRTGTGPRGAIAPQRAKMRRPPTADRGRRSRKRATDRSRTGAGPRGAKPRSGPRCDGRHWRTEGGEAGKERPRGRGREPAASRDSGGRHEAVTVNDGRQAACIVDGSLF
jgi:hypothetical protein